MAATVVVLLVIALIATTTRVARAADARASAATRATTLEIAELREQASGLERTLDVKRSAQRSLRARLNAAESRLRGLQAAEAAAQRLLSEQLVGAYEGDRLDLVGVVVSSTGFENLLEQLAFAERVGRHDAEVITRVGAARRAIAAEAAMIGGLSVHVHHVAEQALSARSRLSTAQVALVSRQLAATRARATATGQLTSAQTQVAALTSQLVTLREGQAAAGASSPPGAAARTTTVSSTRGLVFPMSRAAVAPPATWSLRGGGVDIAAAGGTPELAVCSGTIVLHGIGGLGPSAPVLRCDRPLDGYTDVYYGAAGPAGLAPIGARVSHGQPIAEVGQGLVGNSTGPHLEISFADAAGMPLGRAAAAHMLSLLHAADAG